MNKENELNSLKDSAEGAGKVIPGNKQIAKKRQWAFQQDEKMRKERSAQWIRRIEGVNTLRKGMMRSFG